MGNNMREEDLSAWRGMLFGVLLGTAIWAFVAMILWLWLY